MGNDLDGGQPPRKDDGSSSGFGGTDTRGLSSSSLFPKTIAGPPPPGVAPSLDPLIKAKLGNLVVESVLGRGGFGTVYKARDEKLNRDVAVKVLRNPLDLDHLRLFEREAKAIASLSKHPSIIQIFEWGEYEGRAFFVLEYAENNAARLLEEYPDGLPVVKALQIALETAEALDYAHKRGVLHRDIKPGNLLISREFGKVKVADFGLVKIQGVESATHSGHISGSPPYMSPEQVAGTPLDARSDIFSLGVTLYELLSNNRPFPGDTPESVMTSIREGRKTPLAAHRPDLPLPLLDLVEKAIARSPEERYQSADDVAMELRSMLRQLERRGHIQETAVRAAHSSQIQRYARLGVPLLAVIALVISAVIYLSFQQYHGLDDNVALAQADRHMDEGDFAAAEAAYRKALEAGQQKAPVFYGLGYAEMMLGRLSQAGEAFSGVDDARLAAECRAALALAAGDAAQTAHVEALREAERTRYADVLLAKMSALNRRFEEARSLVEGAERAHFRFQWQYAEALHLLGQAYYHLGAHEQALTAFEQVKTSGMAGKTSVADAYLTAIRSQMNAEQRERASAAARRIRDLIDNGAEDVSPVERWTSRPLSFFVLPVQADASVYAVASGLADTLPWLLGQALDAKTPMQLVDRDHIAAVLQEQELSALLSTRSGQLSLGHVLGARLALQCRFATIGGQEKALMTVVDVETTERIPVPPVDVMPQTPPDSLVSALASSIHDAARSAYPLRGRIHLGVNGPEINIGTAAGVHEGMRFMLMPTPGDDPIPGVAIHPQRVREDTAAVTVEGLESASIPTVAEEAWYVLEQREAS